MPTLNALQMFTENSNVKWPRTVRKWWSLGSKPDNLILEIILLISAPYHLVCTNFA